MRFRPHHFLCTLGFVGEGYSPAFTENFSRLKSKLESEGGDQTWIEVVREADDICGPCPSRRGVGCETQAKIDSLDERHARVLGLQGGEKITWAQAKRLLAERVSLERFQAMCAGCEWQSTGHCERALKKLGGIAAALPPSVGLLLALAIALPFGTPATWAKTSPKTKAARVAYRRPSAATLEANLKQAKLPSAYKAIRAAWDFYDKDQCEKALPKASQAEKEASLVDHALAIQALCETRLAGLAVLQKKGGSLERAQKAQRLWSRLRTGFPLSPWMEQSAHEIAISELIAAQAQRAKKNWRASADESERAFQRLAMEGELGSLVPDDLSGYAQACLKLPKRESCPSWILRLSSAFPKASPEFKAMAKTHSSITDQARPNYATGKVTMPYKSRDADDMALEAALAPLWENKKGDAITALKKFLEDFPRSAQRFRARFWLGRAQFWDGDEKEAKATWQSVLDETPLSYYGLISAMQLGVSPEDKITTKVPDVVNGDAFQTPMEIFRVRRAEKLIGAGANELAIRDLREIRARDTATSGYLMYLASLNSIAGGHPTAFSILGELIQRGEPGILTPYGLSLIFPIRELDEIRKQADLNGIDPLVTLSLIKQESAFDPDALSASNAIGLMQLLYTTALDTDPKSERARLHDPATNIRVGTKYLKKLIDRWNGNLALAISSYNAGPNAVDRWFKEFQNKQKNNSEFGMLEFFEMIPYKETREYAPAILRNYFWYSKLIVGSTPKDFKAFWRTISTDE